jgi:hypothetical protein
VNLGEFARPSDGPFVPLSRFGATALRSIRSMKPTRAKLLRRLTGGLQKALVLKNSARAGTIRREVRRLLCLP